MNSFTAASKIWTVHGLWPTKDGEIGPSYCDRSAKFDPEKVGQCAIKYNYKLV